MADVDHALTPGQVLTQNGREPLPSSNLKGLPRKSRPFLRIVLGSFPNAGDGQRALFWRRADQLLGLGARQMIELLVLFGLFAGIVAAR